MLTASMCVMNSEVGALAKIELKAVTKHFGDVDRAVRTLDEVSLRVDDGEFVAIVGPPECGKSTLLQIVANLQTPSTGQVYLRGSQVDRPANVMVLHEHALLPRLTVRENVACDLGNRDIDDTPYFPQADRQLVRLGLDGCAHLYPHQLSAGTKQCVGVARALTQQPEILLMDEPLGALDDEPRELMQEQLLELREESKPTCLYITHSIDEAVLLADRVVLMTASPGRISKYINVPFRGSRDSGLRHTTEFAQVSERIWEDLQEESRRP